jgi:hypothetical protein
MYQGMGELKRELVDAPERSGENAVIQPLRLHEFG